MLNGVYWRVSGTCGSPSGKHKKKSEHQEYTSSFICKCIFVLCSHIRFHSILRNAFTFLPAFFVAIRNFKGIFKGI